MSLKISISRSCQKYPERHLTREYFEKLFLVTSRALDRLIDLADMIEAVIVMPDTHDPPEEGRIYFTICMREPQSQIGGVSADRDVTPEKIPIKQFYLYLDRNEPIPELVASVVDKFTDEIIPEFLLRQMLLRSQVDAMEKGMEALQKIAPGRVRRAKEVWEQARSAS